MDTIIFFLILKCNFVSSFKKKIALFVFPITNITLIRYKSKKNKTNKTKLRFLSYKDRTSLQSETKNSIHILNISF